MGKETNIEWCDSTLNLQMGCDGCELWAGESRHCYAGVLTERYAGQKGWLEKFTAPKIFTERLDAALRWPDLTGKERPEKPWLNGYPRLIFLNDMGDTFTESLPLDWLAPLFPRMEQSPHRWLILTKRPERARKLSKLFLFPQNFWIGTSVTGPENLHRVEILAEIDAKVKFVSIEPLLRFIHPSASSLSRFEWIILGGESGANARPMDLGSARKIRDRCNAADVPFFFKQWGEWKPIGEDCGERVGKVAAGRKLDGREWNGMPRL